MGKAIVCSSVIGASVTRFLPPSDIWVVLPQLAWSALLMIFVFAGRPFVGPVCQLLYLTFWEARPFSYHTDWIPSDGPGAFRFPHFVFSSAPSRRFFRIHLVRCRFLSYFLVLLVWFSCCLPVLCFLLGIRVVWRRVGGQWGLFATLILLIFPRISSAFFWSPRCSPFIICSGCVDSAPCCSRISSIDSTPCFDMLF